MGRGHTTVRNWITGLGVELRPQHASRRRAYAVRRGEPPDTRPRCTRCEILLEHAPDGRDGLCGWCIEDADPTRDARDVYVSDIARQQWR